MIKIFIGHFIWLPDNPDVSAWDPAQVGEGGVVVLREVDSGLWGTGGPPRVWEGSRTLRRWVVREGWAGLRSPDRNSSTGEDVSGTLPGAGEGARRGENLPPTSFPPA